DIGPPIRLMLEVALLFQAAQQCADGGFLQASAAGDHLMHRLDSARPAVPYGLHHFVFKVGEGGANAGVRSFTVCHGTFCTTKQKRCQDLLGFWGRVSGSLLRTSRNRTSGPERLRVPCSRRTIHTLRGRETS